MQKETQVKDGHIQTWMGLIRIDRPSHRSKTGFIECMQCDVR